MFDIPWDKGQDRGMKPSKSRQKQTDYWNHASIRSVWAKGPRKGRGLRVLPEEGGYFVHVTSRTAGQEFLFGDAEKAAFRWRMRQWAEFSGIGILTHCLMSNHFHLLLWVPRPEALDHKEILRRLEGVWPEEKRRAWEETWRAQTPERRERMDAAVRERMADLPEFMRVLKQSFTAWYNRTHHRKGALWDARYRSVVVEDNPLALLSVAAYIDLNPVRAGICADPLDYSWSGYGEACGGQAASRSGLEALVRLSRGHQPYAATRVRKGQLKSEKHWSEAAETLEREQAARAAPRGWPEVQAAYRIWLYHTGRDTSGEHGSKEKHRRRRNFDPLEVVAEFERQGEVPAAKLLRRRVRSFTRGVGVGSPAFLESLMTQYRSCFGPNRRKAGRPIQGESLGLQSLRQVDR